MEFSVCCMLRQYNISYFYDVCGNSEMEWAEKKMVVICFCSHSMCHLIDACVTMDMIF